MATDVTGAQPALPEFREHSMASGLDDYLTKPVDWDALERVLRRYGRVEA